MKAIALILLLSASGFAQTLTLAVSPVNVAPGGTATVSVNFTDTAPSSNTAGLQWNLTLPTGFTVGTGTVGTAGTSAQKVLSCVGLTCILAGTDGATGTSNFQLNATVLSSGVVATFPLTVPSNAAVGANSLSLASIFAASTTGTNVAITTSPAVLTILSRYDLNSDGAVNLADVTIVLNQATGQAPCTTGDVNGDGKCNVLDVLLVVLAANGVIH